ncbi:MAG: family 78 glycoside hydrolase catalytic domain, partial [Blautia sp.]|nr:family 78 glycoside hydrolase catalytic domain [Blautia sp.]
SGRMEDRTSTGICYRGEALKACTRYNVQVTVWGKDEGTEEQEASLDSWFETGLLDTSLAAFEGGTFIGAPEKYLSARTMGVFVLSSKIRITEGKSRAGIVFGAKDARLMDPRKNQYEIAGDNYIRYVLDVSRIPATLEIWRVGYAPQDRSDAPFYTGPVREILRTKDNGMEEGAPVITEENRYQEHELKIEVIGDCAYAYLDGLLIDGEMRHGMMGDSLEARQLNPLDYNDTTTFPRLCEIGYYVGAGDEAHFSGISVRNYRTPRAEVVCLDREGLSLKGEDGTGCPVEMQITRDPSVHSLPMFRRNFTVRENRKEARLYITARGIYDCRLNGKPVTDTLLNPGCTQFDRHLLYQTYDVTDLLSGGENGIGVTLSSGWWCDAQTFVLRNYNYYGDKESFLAKLVVTYEDGSRDVVATDPEEWEYYGEGPYIYGGLFQGEQLCGQRLWEFEQFSLPDFHRIFSARSEDARKDAQEDGLFKKPAAVAPVPIESTVTMPAGFGRPWPAVNQGETCLSGSVQAPVKEVCRLHAVSMTEPRKGLYIYDLGQEMAGIPRLRLKGRAGDLVTVRYGEMLYPELPEYGSLHGLMLTENYRDAESIDLYTLRGDEEGEIYQPRFTFHGFRYIEISGVAEPPALEEVEGIQISSVSAITGGVKTSDALVNRLAENVKWSQLCNFISIPTDCPQRNERMGWAGDTHVFCRTASYQSDTRLFYYRYLEALRDLQEEDGSLPEIAPVGGGFGGITYEGAMIFILWELYQHYGDTQIVREYYPAARKWMDCIREKGMPGMAFVGPIDDWLAPAHTDSHLVWNAFYVRYTILMKRLARAIGEETSAVYFEKLEKEARAWFNETFVDPETGRTRGADGKLNETQCSYALPLAYEVFEEKYRENAYRYLAEATEKVECTMDITTVPAQADGYKTIVATLMLDCDRGLVWEMVPFDKYTGMAMVIHRLGYGENECKGNVTVRDKSYDVEYTVDIGRGSDGRSSSVYKVTVPEEYDGLMF